MVSEMKDQPPRTTKTVILTAFSICNEIFDNYLPGTQYSQEFHSFQPDESGYNPATIFQLPR